MSTLKKTIVLTNSKVPNYKVSAILTLNKESSSVYGTIKVFNLEKCNNLVLGLAQNHKQVYKQSIALINNNTYNFSLSNINLDMPISCVLVEDTPTKVIPLIWGSDNNNQLKDEIVSNFQASKNTHTSSQNGVVNNFNLKTQNNSPITSINPISNKPNLDDSNNTQPINNNNQNNSPSLSTNLDDDLFSYSDEEIEKEIDNELSKDDEFINPDNTFDNDLNNNPDYKHFDPYTEKRESISKVLNSNNIIDQEVAELDIPNNVTFYDAVSEQLNDLFNKYPAENNLETLIPNSKWVKIDYENDGRYYVLGLIYEDIALKYICYGVPGEYSEVAPNGLDEYSQWLPIDVNNPKNKGYWVMYQDAITGESILVDAI